MLGNRGATIVSPDHFMLYTPLLPEAASGTLERRGIEIRVGTSLARFDGAQFELSGGETIAARTLVWAAGVKAHPLLSAFGLPLDGRGRVIVESTLQVEGRERIWASATALPSPTRRRPGRSTHRRASTPSARLDGSRGTSRGLRGRTGTG
jgi:NADH dehydrogenase